MMDRNDLENSTSIVGRHKKKKESLFNAHTQGQAGEAKSMFGR